MSYEFLLFDLDHTLLDSSASQAAAYELTMREAGVDDPAGHFDRFTRINEALWADVEAGRIQPDDVRVARFAQLVAEIRIDADPETMGETFVRGLSTNGDLFPGATKMLDDVTSTASLALVSNGIGSVQRARIDRLGIEHYFDAILISGEVGTAKPSSAIFDLTFEQLGQPPKPSAVMIGDSLSSDIAGGNNYGIDTCWFNRLGIPTPSEPTATHEITSLTQLANLVS